MEEGIKNESPKALKNNVRDTRTVTKDDGTEIYTCVEKLPYDKGGVKYIIENRVTCPMTSKGSYSDYSEEESYSDKTWRGCKKYISDTNPLTVDTSDMLLEHLTELLK